MADPIHPVVRSRDVRCFKEAPALLGVMWIHSTGHDFTMAEDGSVKVMAQIL